MSQERKNKRQADLSLWKSCENLVKWPIYVSQLLHTWKSGKEPYVKPDNIIVVVGNLLSICWQMTINYFSVFFFFYCFKYFILQLINTQQQFSFHFQPENVLISTNHVIICNTYRNCFPLLVCKSSIYSFFSRFVAISKLVLVKEYITSLHITDTTFRIRFKDYSQIIPDYLSNL